jgi:protein involved in polysaccharide export with SLBB domain
MRRSWVLGFLVASLLSGPALAIDKTIDNLAETLNPLEKLYSDRIGSNIRRLGADDLGPASATTPSQATSVQTGDDYRMDTGDRLSIWLRGGINRQEEIAINADGTLILSDLPPIQARGQTLGALRSQIERAVKQQYPDTDAFISPAGLRQITLLISGAIVRPGPIQIPANSDLLTALRAAGGITPLGSHRAVTLVTNKGTTRQIDLYPLLRGGAAAVPLTDQDRIEIGPIGATIAVTGAVKNPAILELIPTNTLTTTSAIDLVGGPLMAKGSQIILSRLDDQGREQQTTLARNDQQTLQDGDILTITAQTAPQTGGLRLLQPGRPALTIALDNAPTLGRLINDPAIIGQDIYPLIGVIQRRPGDGFAGEMIAFSPAEIRSGNNDRRLEDRDEIILFPTSQFPLPERADTVQAIGHENRDLEHLLMEMAVPVTGSVRRPGRYPVGGQVSAALLIATAGGKRIEAAPDGLEIIRRAGGDIEQNANETNLIGAGDAIRLAGDPRGPAQSNVRLDGAVRFPGDYPIQPGEKLSSVINRAGGLTDQAYALGAVFTRLSEQKNEQARYVEAARHLDAALSRQLSAEEKPNRDLIDSTRSLSRELRQTPALGRITIEADPDRLAANPALDIVLENGDTITWPQRAPIVRVMGEVQSPATLQFITGKQPIDYLAEAGGYTAFADTGRSFVLLPDGRAKPLSPSSWRRDDASIPPGSTLIVPRDAKPLDTLQITTAVGNIIGQIAITAASIATIQDNNR